MADNGKLEAQVTSPTAGYSMSITEVGGGGGPVAVYVLPVGTYYHSSAGSGANDIAATIAAALTADGTLSGTYSCSISAGESGTGRITLSATGITSFTITWTSTVLRDLLGFDGNETGTLSYTSNDHAQALWLPDYPYQNLNGALHRGGWVTDQAIAKNSNGNVYSVIGQSHREMPLVYPMITRAKTWAVNESRTNESFESFLRQGIHATKSWGTSAGPVRWYGDADTDSEYGTFSVVDLANWSPSQIREQWTGLFAINLGTLIEVP